MIITGILAFILLLIDQLTKYFTLVYKPVNYNAGIATINYVENPGAAFGLGAEYTWVLVLISGVATILLGYWMLKNDWKHGKFGALGATLAFSGCVGNLIDRVLMLFGERGGVIDMVVFKPWNWFLSLFHAGENTFNAADVFLVFGLIMVAIDILFLYDKRARKYGYYSKK